jgi:hypothetical protein
LFTSCAGILVIERGALDPPLRLSLKKKARPFLAAREAEESNIW